MSENKDESGIEKGEFVEYRVALFKTFQGILILIMEAIILIFGIIELCYEKGSLFAFFVSTSITAILPFIVLAKNMTYVKLSKNYFIVNRRIYCFKKEFVYENSNIQEIVFEHIRYGKGGDDILTIITNGLEKQSYKVNLFKRRTFFDLKNALISYGINVTDKLDLTEREFKTFMHK